MKAFFSLTFWDIRRKFRNELIGKLFERYIQEHINYNVL
jgi:hypothetical protein